ncbi:hypothetical protein [Sandaracinus amylolyticus]|uniref:Uncharacterized protein n=1 Tax=Sandaracinus amylolyticus TaxID=927083 RepID=A0A0F6W3E3_9BACT|nr:hypothetical protein [Sandaracinus amylolyticus]AKF06481.1 hypothetical protein DB32_003630 [Sandaracinus amylolyticus]
MSEPRDDDEGRDESEKGPSPADAKNELFAALGHMKKAAELLVAAADPAVRKAATEAEKALEKVGKEAEPMARQLGAELGKMTRGLVDALEGRRGKSETPQQSDDESEVERLEREAERDDEKKR